MAQNFPNLEKGTDIQVQEVQTVPKKMSLKRITPRHIIIKVSKVKHKERILKATGKQIINYIQGKPIEYQLIFQ